MLVVALPVSSGDDQHYPAPKELVVQQLRQRTEWNAFIEDVLEFDVASRHGIADDDEIRARLEITGVEGLGDGNVEAARRKSDMGGYAAASEPVTRRKPRSLSMFSRERGHGSATNTDQVDVFFLVHLIFQSIPRRARVLEETRRPAYPSTADSKIRRATLLSLTFRLARIPNGSVMFPDETWPDFTPKATGTPRSPTIRAITSCKV